MKEFLSQKGVPFTEKDVVADPKAMEELVHMNMFATPVTVIEGEAVVGFNRERLETLLAKRGR